VLGADGARSQVAKQGIPKHADVPWVLAYHEIVEAPEMATTDYDPERCEVWYQGGLSPDFYAWVFPHGKSASIGVGSAYKDFSAKKSVNELRAISGLDTAETIRKEGAPIPMKPMKRWDDGKALLVSGDAAGVVAPASGEGIYYAMLCGRLSADAIKEFLVTGKASALRSPRKRFMKLHGRTFFALGLLQYFWYHSDKRREQFVEMCKDEDVQTLTWQAYTQKKLVKRKKKEHLRVFIKDVAQLLGLSKTAA
jgi:geranylgeranyl reductase